VVYKLPRTFEYVDEPLRDDAGKVRRSALRAARLPRTTIVSSDGLTGQTVELLQALIRNACVNDGTADVGPRDPQLRAAAASSWAAPASTCRPSGPPPGRTSLVARIEGTDPRRAVAVR
jgi:hypothetical protein